MVLAVIVTICVPSFAAENRQVDILEDHNAASREQVEPVTLWDWSRGIYTGNFDITQWTNTNYYFKNTAGTLYYRISGTSTANKQCSVQTWCKQCDSKIGEYTFYPSSTPASRAVTLGSHATHNVYLKIIAYDGGWFWSNNDFKGTIKVWKSSISA